jgi:hypothetical protein
VAVRNMPDFLLQQSEFPVGAARALVARIGELPAEAALDMEVGERLTGWYAATREQIRRARARGVKAKVPMAWVFSGAPGTGKRQHARARVGGFVRVLGLIRHSRPSCSGMGKQRPQAWAFPCRNTTAVWWFWKTQLSCRT